ncbi:hypothetical protein GM921_09805 [Pedobacter sp. LMG 31464]|uniref:Uncharacterized protein n=1 Tax=Pedobacter planticolens TaxID=2679964 RepID=A0A923DZ78_9SPHI|nr:hypothetical protein [Pedobacter planticolens]MBB2145781.1 hypothetical protein [Pedobacter planticolens]
MKIKLADLEKMLSTILLNYKEMYGNEIKIENDYYWAFDEKEIYTINEEPNDFSLGQLTDDWETLQHNFKSDNLIPYDLQRISSILTALSIEKPI